MAAGPIPPDTLIGRVGVAADTAQERAALFDQVGRDAHADIVAALPRGWTWNGKRILDFGCGSGRVLRWFVPYIDEGVELMGCDIHAPSIAWLSAQYPRVRIYVNEAEPPLPEPDASFDLVYCSSVFSHLMDWAPWLLEIRRLLRPGGLLVSSVLGRGSWGFGVAGARGEPWDEDTTGLLIEYPGAGFEDTWGPAVFVSEWWLRAHWGRALQILRFEPTGFASPVDRSGGQAWVVGQRDGRADPPTVDDLRAPSSDPRELPSALRAQQLAYEEAAGYLAEVARLGKRNRRQICVDRPLKVLAVIGILSTVSIWGWVFLKMRTGQAPWNAVMNEDDPGS
jgi:SAM-dependent methyltransferase